MRRLEKRETLATAFLFLLRNVKAKLVGSMKNFILIPDSFKGTLSSWEICEIMAQTIQKIFPDACIRSIPVADGGEGTVDAFLSALGGRKISVSVTGPDFRKRDAFYGILPDGKTAVVEMAACAGLPLVRNRENPEITTTLGVGELFLHAAKKGCRKIIVGLGGSCTNDAGTGAAAACGIRFLDETGKAFVPTGETLARIAKIDTSSRNSLLDGLEMVAMCDVDNPFRGPAGAAFVFAPQKGADETMVKRLDAGLCHCEAVIQRDLGTEIFSRTGKKSIFTLPGTGAAGGMGGGMIAFFQSKLQKGIETVLDTVRFEELLSNTDLVFTGEGKIDEQTLRGKVVLGVASRTQKAGVPLIAVVGDVGENIQEVYARGVSAIFSINQVAVPFSQARLRTNHDLAMEMENILRLLLLKGGRLAHF